MRWGTTRLSGWGRGEDIVLRASQHRDVRYELTPGAQGWAWGKDISVNPAGYIGPEPRTGTQARDRIIVLGDSITFGNNLPADQTYPAQLRQRFNQEGVDCDILNFGLGGYDTIQEVATLEHKGLQYKPRLVIVGFCLNDVGVVSTNLLYITHAKKYFTNPVITHSRLIQFLLTRWDRKKLGDFYTWQNTPSVFMESYRDRIDAIGQDEVELRRLMNTAGAYYPSQWYRDDFRIGRLRHAFGWLSSLSQRHGFDVVVMIIPWLETVDGRYRHEDIPPDCRIRSAALRFRCPGFNAGISPTRRN